MSNDWYIKFYSMHRIGAREQFQVACFEILRKKYPNNIFNIIRVSKGDQGIDIISKDPITKQKTIYQCKFFDQPSIRSSQRQNIKESFERAHSANDNFDKWSLCVAVDLSNDELEWWEKWQKGKQEETNIIIELLAGSTLIAISKEVECYNYIFGDTFKDQISDLHKYFIKSKVNNLNIPIYDNISYESLIIGFLIDGSEHITSAIANNQFESNEEYLKEIITLTQIKREAVRKGFEEQLKKIYTFILSYSKKAQLRNEILSVFWGTQNKNTTIDLLEFNEKLEVIIDLYSFNENFDDIQKRIFQKIILYELFVGGADLLNGLQTAKKYFFILKNVKDKILVVFTSGEISKNTEEDINNILLDLKRGITILVVYLNKDMSQFNGTFVMYDSLQKNWNQSTKRAFCISSSVSSNSFLHKRINSIAEINDISVNKETKLFFPLISEKTLTFLKSILFGNMHEK
ncbi:MAG: VWA domain-containing protein [Leptospiraceae bacterium]|nr:VWA domain-containing protein [Leptospiraceae bacterium]